MSKRNIKVTGLKTATSEEILELTSRFRSQGFRVEHRTHTTAGEKLPFNGILVATTGRSGL
jgi:hypothetical protein